MCTSFSKCFWGGGHIKVGDGLQAEGNPLIAHRTPACRGVRGHPFPGNVWNLDAQWCDLVQSGGPEGWCISFLPTWFTITCNISNNNIFILFHDHFNTLFEGRRNYTEVCVVVCMCHDPTRFLPVKPFAWFRELRNKNLFRYLETTFTCYINIVLCDTVKSNWIIMAV